MDLNSVIWISSVDHLDNFVKVIKSSFFVERLFGNFSLPEGFPRAKSNPLAYFSRGDVLIRDNNLMYNCFDDSDSEKYQYLKDDLSFILSSSNIESFEKYSFKEFSPYGLVGTVYMQNWIRIICDDNILGGDFLIGSDSVKNTSKLFKMLEQLTTGQEVTECLETNSEKYVFMGYLGIIVAYLSIFFMWESMALDGTWQLIFFTLLALSVFSTLILLFIFVSWAQGRNEKVQRHLQIIATNIFVFLVILSILKPIL
ncbi:hypothetical protein [Methanobacterium petrolearium]|uniref:hypothetical protein n=1 Tax=Methanobacterium petrolearium TaxID=710190 RepID=UPI001AEB7D7E|nr:hypothetical protein [Methanobacterium petrolearium]MBP1945698.1 hypothetical protein [Methanobacterium petrolearium]BDZ71944.1 hypothetical protein GCM10025861_24610 [Methanobacterium petrolearium]